ncbi:MAG: ATP-binding protein, partial [Bradymonadales bacterium]
MNNYVDNTPNAARLMESLRSSGYDNYSAICDIIDNAFDANADMVKVDIGEAGKEYVISVADNGDGMAPEILDQAMKLGSITGREDENLGKYGMGLITGSISMGRRLTVISKYNDRYYTAIQDLDEVARENKFVKTIRESNPIEIARFNELLGGAESGTIVTIQKVDNLQNKSMPQFQAKLMKDCGEIYRYFINSNKKIYINKKEVHAVDPLMLDLHNTETFLDITEDITGDDGKPTGIRMRVVALPKVSDQEAKAMKMNIQNQGFYLMRNNRQITKGESFGVFSKHNDFNRFRAEIFVSGDLDRKIGINFRKEGNKLSDDIYAWIERHAFPQLRSIRDIAKRDQKASGKKVDHTGSSRTIENKSSVLKKPRLDKNDVSPDLAGISPDAFTNVDFAVESNTRLAPLFQFDVKGKDIKINYNNDHPFYQQVFAEIRDNPNLTSAVDFLIYSTAIALVEITST